MFKVICGSAKKAATFLRGKALAMAAGVALASAALLGPVGTASAAGVAAVDVADVVTGITNQAASISTIGTTILGIVVGIIAFRWVRRVLK